MFPHRVHSAFSHTHPQQPNVTTPQLAATLWEQVCANSVQEWSVLHVYTAQQCLLDVCLEAKLQCREPLALSASNC